MRIVRETRNDQRKLKLHILQRSHSENNKNNKSISYEIISISTI